MSGERVCVTNDVPELRSCVSKGRHLARCDGWAKRFNPETRQTESAYTMEVDPDTGENVRILVECGGCLPKPAMTGLLCFDHTAKLDQALRHDDVTGWMLVDLVTHMWSINSEGVTDDGERGAIVFGSRWNLSSSRVAASEVYAALASVAVEFTKVLHITPEPDWLWSPRASMFVGFATTATPSEVASDTATLIDYLDAYRSRALSRKPAAAAVVRLVNVIQAAYRRFPLTDAEHRVPSVRCPSCGQMALTWHPPLYFEGPVTITCEKCGAETDQDWLEHYVSTIRTDPRRMKR